MSKSLEEKRLIIQGYCFDKRENGCKDCVIKNTCFTRDELNNNINIVEDLYKKVKKDLKSDNKNPNRDLKLKDAESKDSVIKFYPNYASDYKSEYEEIMCVECWDNEDEEEEVSIPNVILSLNIKQIKKLKNYLKEVLNYVEEN